MKNKFRILFFGLSLSYLFSCSLRKESFDQKSMQSVRKGGGADRPNELTPDEAAQKIQNFYRYIKSQEFLGHNPTEEGLKSFERLLKKKTIFREFKSARKPKAIQQIMSIDYELPLEEKIRNGLLEGVRISTSSKKRSNKQPDFNFQKKIDLGLIEILNPSTKEWDHVFSEEELLERFLRYNYTDKTKSVLFFLTTPEGDHNGAFNWNLKSSKSLLGTIAETRNIKLIRGRVKDLKEIASSYEGPKFHQLVLAGHGDKTKFRITLGKNDDLDSTSLKEISLKNLLRKQANISLFACSIGYFSRENPLIQELIEKLKSIGGGSIMAPIMNSASGVKSKSPSYRVASRSSPHKFLIVRRPHSHQKEELISSFMVRVKERPSLYFEGFPRNDLLEILENENPEYVNREKGNEFWDGLLTEKTFKDRIFFYRDKKSKKILLKRGGNPEDFEQWTSFVSENVTLFRGELARVIADASLFSLKKSDATLAYKAQEKEDLKNLVNGFKLLCETFTANNSWLKTSLIKDLEYGLDELLNMGCSTKFTPFMEHLIIANQDISFMNFYFLKSKNDRNILQEYIFRGSLVTVTENVRTPFELIFYHNSLQTLKNFNFNLSNRIAPQCDEDLAKILEINPLISLEDKINLGKKLVTECLENSHSEEVILIEFLEALGNELFDGIDRSSDSNPSYLYTVAEESELETVKDYLLKRNGGELLCRLIDSKEEKTLRQVLERRKTLLAEDYKSIRCGIHKEHMLLEYSIIYDSKDAKDILSLYSKIDKENRNFNFYERKLVDELGIEASIFDLILLHNRLDLYNAFQNVGYEKFQNSSFPICDEGLVDYLRPTETSRKGEKDPLIQKVISDCSKGEDLDDEDLMAFIEELDIEPDQFTITRNGIKLNLQKMAEVDGRYELLSYLRERKG